MQSDTHRADSYECAGNLTHGQWAPLYCIYNKEWTNKQTNSLLAIQRAINARSVPGICVSHREHQNEI